MQNRSPETYLGFSFENIQTTLEQCLPGFRQWVENTADALAHNEHENPGPFHRDDAALEVTRYLIGYLQYACPVEPDGIHPFVIMPSQLTTAHFKDWFEFCGRVTQ